MTIVLRNKSQLHTHTHTSAMLALLFTLLIHVNRTNCLKGHCSRLLCSDFMSTKNTEIWVPFPIPSPLRYTLDRAHAISLWAREVRWATDFLVTYGLNMPLPMLSCATTRIPIFFQWLPGQSISYIIVVTGSPVVVL